MRSKFETRTQNTLDDKDRLYFRYNPYDDSIDITFCDSSDSVSEYSMSSYKFLKSLSNSVELFDDRQLEILKKASSILFTQIKKIEAANELHKDAVDSSEAA